VKTLSFRCLTVRQPWAWLIIAGHKDIENRSWTHPYRGPLAIHAGLDFDDAGAEFARSLGIEVPTRTACRRGSVIGLVDIVDIWPSSSPWAFAKHEHWWLANPRPIVPFGAKGQLGLWSVGIEERFLTPPSPTPALTLSPYEFPEDRHDG
jgi:hypothetical protein